MSNNNNGYGSNVSNLTNTDGIFAEMDMQDKMEKKFNEQFVNDYNTMENIGTVIEAFKHAFYEFFQNFIDPEKLKVIYKTFNENNIVTIKFLHKNIKNLNSNYKTNNRAFTSLSEEEQKDINNYINALSEDAVKSLMSMAMGTQRGGKRRKKRKDKTRKQRKTKRNKAKSKAKSKRRRTKRN
jgi:hypothetical protein